MLHLHSVLTIVTNAVCGLRCFLAEGGGTFYEASSITDYVMWGMVG
jgi:hypothetical protein